MFQNVLWFFVSKQATVFIAYKKVWDKTKIWYHSVLDICSDSFKKDKAWNCSSVNESIMCIVSINPIWILNWLYDNEIQHGGVCYYEFAKVRVASRRSIAQWNFVLKYIYHENKVILYTLSQVNVTIIE